VTMPMFIS